MTIKPAGRTLEEFQPLKPAEQKLLDACRLGEFAHISAERPESENNDNTVRAAFLRFIALGGDEKSPVHEHGVRLRGAWIADELDMESTVIPSNLGIVQCHFDTAPVFRGANIAGTLNLCGCHLPGLKGDSLACDGGLFLRQFQHQNFSSTEEVRLLGAQIGGVLDCSGAKFDGKDSNALSADGAVIKGGVFLKAGFIAMGAVRLPGAHIGGNLECDGAKLNGKKGSALFADSAAIKGSAFLRDGFTAEGGVWLLGTQIDGDLDCSAAKFDGKEGYALAADRAVIRGSVFLNAGFIAIGQVRLYGAQIGGNLECSSAKIDGKDGDALVAEGMVVKGTFFLRKLSEPVNGVSLAPARVGQLVDDANSWGKNLILDGFIYGSITGGVPTDAATRLAWLDKQRPAHAGLDSAGSAFKPQPWRQLAKVLREMGHAEDARQVSIKFEERLRKANLIGQTPKEWNKLLSWSYRMISRAGHGLFGILTGYGYRPLRLLGWMFVVWLLCAGLYWCAALNGVFAPSDPLVFQNPEYAACRPDFIALAPQHSDTIPPNMQGAGNWYLCDKLRGEYAGFSPLAYSLDVILPLVDLQQESSWSPLIPTPKAVWYQELAAVCDRYHLTRLLLWFEILFGWVSSLLLVAVVSGLTKRREE